MRHPLARLLGLVAIVGPALLGGAPACSTTPKGGLILAVNTDMEAPKDVNAVAVSISSGGRLKYSFLGRVTPEGEVLLPSTLAIVEPDDPNDLLRIRVIAFQERKPRVLRDVRTTAPRDGRIALLRLPLNFVNDASATGELVADALPPKATSAGPTGTRSKVVTLDKATLFPREFDPNDGTIKSICANPDETVIDGECRDSFVDSSTLPTYEDALVFGEGAAEGACFDAGRCLAAAEKVPLRSETSDGNGLDLATCVVQRGPVDASRLNLALATPDTGVCVAPGRCFVPLDEGAAYFHEGTTTRFVPGICRKLQQGAQLWADRGGACEAKKESAPLCRVGSLPPVPVDGGADADASTDGAVPPGAQLVAGEDFPMSVAMSGATLFVASDDRVASTDRGANKTLTAVPGFPPGVPSGRILRALVDGAPQQRIAVVLDATREVFVRDTATSFALAPLPPPGPGMIRDMIELPSANKLLFSTAEGLYTTPISVSATSQPVGPRTSVQAVTRHRGGLAFVQDGFLQVCPTEAAAGCPSRHNVAQEPFAIAGTASDPERFFALFADGLSEITTASSSKLVNAPTARPPGYPNARNHELVLSGSCLFFTDNTGSVQVFDVKTNVGKPLANPLAPALDAGVPDGSPPLEYPTLGLTVDLEKPGDNESGYVYWTYYRAKADGGGVYRVKIPPACK